MLAFSLNNLGNLLTKMGQWYKAEIAYKDAGAILFDIFGKHHMNVSANLFSKQIVFDLFNF